MQKLQIDSRLDGLDEYEYLINEYKSSSTAFRENYLKGYEEIEAQIDPYDGMGMAIRPGIIYPSNIDRKITEIRNEFRTYLTMEESKDIKKIVEMMGQLDRLELQKHIWNDDSFPVLDAEVEI